MPFSSLRPRNNPGQSGATQVDPTANARPMSGRKGTMKVILILVIAAGHTPAFSPDVISAETLPCRTLNARDKTGVSTGGND